MNTEMHLIEGSTALSGPSLGDIMEVRASVTKALEIGARLLDDLQNRLDSTPDGDPEAFQIREDASEMVEILERLRVNTEGYLSDFQFSEVRRLSADAGLIEDGATDLGAIGKPLAEIQEGYGTELLRAVESVEEELVKHEAEIIPVRERKKGNTAEAVLILAALGVLAWALS